MPAAAEEGIYFRSVWPSASATSPDSEEFAVSQLLDTGPASESEGTDSPSTAATSAKPEPRTSAKEAEVP